MSWTKLLLYVVWIDIIRGSRVIKSARDLYQTPHGLDLVRYMLYAQPDFQDKLTTTATATTTTATATTTAATVTTTATNSSSWTRRDSDVDIKDFPYVVSLQVRFNATWYFLCGGSLVSRNKVLTATHCLLGSPPGIRFRVIVGTNVYFERPHDQVIDVIEAYVHPRFDITGRPGRRGLYAHDVAILKLTSDVTLSEAVQPIALADRGVSYTGRRCVLAGYGISDTDNPGQARLQAAHLTVVSTRQCQQQVDTSVLVRVKVHIRDLHVCTVDEGVVPCMGDSGSALVCGGKAYGVYSFGDTSCAADGHLPRGFMSVRWYRSWLQHLIEL